jgi:hypothetical protein
MATKVNKEKSSHNQQFAKGGDGHMFGPQGANPQRPGKTDHNAAGGPGADFAKGGSGKMFGFAGSSPAQAGKTSAR